MKAHIRCGTVSQNEILEINIVLEAGIGLRLVTSQIIGTLHTSTIHFVLLQSIPVILKCDQFDCSESTFVEYLKENLDTEIYLQSCEKRIKNSFIDAFDHPHEFFENNPIGEVTKSTENLRDEVFTVIEDNEQTKGRHATKMTGKVHETSFEITQNKQTTKEIEVSPQNTKTREESSYVEKPINQQKDLIRNAEMREEPSCAGKTRNQSFADPEPEEMFVENPCLPHIRSLDEAKLNVISLNLKTNLKLAQESLSPSGFLHDEKNNSNIATDVVDGIKKLHLSDNLNSKQTCNPSVSCIEDIISDKHDCIQNINTITDEASKIQTDMQINEIKPVDSTDKLLFPYSPLSMATNSISRLKNSIVSKYNNTVDKFKTFKKSQKAIEKNLNNIYCFGHSIFLDSRVLPTYHTDNFIISYKVLVKVYTNTNEINTFEKEFIIKNNPSLNGNMESVIIIPHEHQQITKNHGSFRNVVLDEFFALIQNINSDFERILKDRNFTSTRENLNEGLSNGQSKKKHNYIEGNQSIQKAKQETHKNYFETSRQFNELTQEPENNNYHSEHPTTENKNIQKKYLSADGKNIHTKHTNIDSLNSQNKHLTIENTDQQHFKNQQIVLNKSADPLNQIQKNQAVINSDLQNINSEKINKSKNGRLKNKIHCLNNTDRFKIDSYLIENLLNIEKSILNKKYNRGFKNDNLRSSTPSNKDFKHIKTNPQENLSQEKTLFQNQNELIISYFNAHSNLIETILTHNNYDKRIEFLDKFCKKHYLNDLASLKAEIKPRDIRLRKFAIHIGNSQLAELNINDIFFLMKTNIIYIQFFKNVKKVNIEIKRIEKELSTTCEYETIIFQKEIVTDYCGYINLNVFLDIENSFDIETFFFLSSHKISMCFDKQEIEIPIKIIQPKSYKDIND